tara:strand:+ start:388 stop:1416 length:1029 start_codon:yes stop_codon:yes gene_type:complete
MNLDIFTIDRDEVIESYFLTGNTDYEYALKKFRPLINQLNIQRKIQNKNFYKRLEIDILNGCVMPPITLAFINNNVGNLNTTADFENFVNDNISTGFVLDGIQRLNTLERVYSESKSALDLQRPLFINVVICPSRDNLLYRMVTLNNGQKPMTARHQIEILTSYIYDFKAIGLDVLTEKEAANNSNTKAFKKADIITAYIAFLSNTPNLDNNKIIQEKMDELIARKIIESNITSDGIEFMDVLDEISRLKENERIMKWFKVNNNLIGFCLGIKKSLNAIRNTSPNEFAGSLDIFEEAFSNFDVSKIKLSRERRKFSMLFIEDYDTLKQMDSYDLLLAFNELD